MLSATSAAGTPRPIWWRSARWGNRCWGSRRRPRRDCDGGSLNAEGVRGEGGREGRRRGEGGREEGEGGRRGGREGGREGRREGGCQMPSLCTCQPQKPGHLTIQDTFSGPTFSGVEGSTVHVYVYVHVACYTYTCIDM